MDFLGWGKSHFYSVFSGPLSTCNESKTTRPSQTGVRFKLLKAIAAQVSFFFFPQSKDLSYNINRQQSQRKNHTFSYMIF